ncbi:hypothetical protein BKA62DRAFT_282153 [Auriculariales sp. MPI-PUGE-AT-0066]|nr:hypothetical protein BKA62DRAFT_282153 [Auriculariales sp. MPI-PUGE-AT-0066]
MTIPIHRLSTLTDRLCAEAAQNRTHVDDVRALVRQRQNETEIRRAHTLAELPVPLIERIMVLSGPESSSELANTCRTFRDVATSRPDIFADLSYLDEYRRISSPGAFRRILERSGDLPLKLSVSVPLQEDACIRNELLEIAQRHFKRAAALYLGPYWGHLKPRDTWVLSQWNPSIRAERTDLTWRALSSLLCDPAPRLERLRVFSGAGPVRPSRKPPRFVLPNELFGGDAPRLQAAFLEYVTLPDEPCRALRNIQELSYSPMPDCLSISQLDTVFKTMPQLQALELDISKLVQDDPPMPTGTVTLHSVPLRILRLERICDGIELLFEHVQLAAADTLRSIVLYDDQAEELAYWFAALQKSYPVIRRGLILNFWIELEVSTHALGPPVVVRVFSDEDPSQLRAGKLIRTASSLANLRELVVHEFLWPSLDMEFTDMSDSDHDCPFPELPSLTDLQIILAVPDDYTHNHEDALGIFLSAEAMCSNMPQLRNFMIAHRPRDNWECEMWVDTCTCSHLLPVSLRDIVELLARFRTSHARASQTTRLRSVLLRGLDPVDIDIDVQLARLQELADVVEFEALETRSKSRWSQNDFTWPDDPRGVFNLWSKSSRTHPLTLLGR